MAITSCPIRSKPLTDAPTALDPDSLAERIGQELGRSRWFEMTQARIDAFADCTEDRQFIHVDPERAAQTPFGSTVAHGFLSLAMLSAMSYEALPAIAGAQMGVNYGFDRIRFVSAVPAGTELRARFVLADVQRADRALTLHLDVTVDMKDQDTPALVARWITRQVL